MIIWKDVVGYEGIYMVSSNGDVKALNPQRRKNRKVLSQCINSSGYLVIGLIKDGVQKLKYVHTLITTAFLENPENKKFTNHKNSIRTDNRLENLEWCTAKENTKHMIENGRRPKKNNYPKNRKKAKWQKN